MTGTEPKIDRELLGRVASLTPGQQRWLRTVLQSVLTMEPPSERRAAPEREERRRREKPAPAERPEPPGKRRRQGLDDILRGEEVVEEDYPEIADELRGIGDIADLLRESGGERRRFGEELRRLLEGSDEPSGDGEEDESVSLT